jgi:hypothetical protein
LISFLPIPGKFSVKYAHRIIKGGVGHNLPQEAPQDFAKAVVDVERYRLALAFRQLGVVLENTLRG